METLIFNLSGQGAAYTKPHINSVNLTYQHIHKPALLGMLGAILGMKGHSSKKKDEEFPEFYEKLKGLKVAILPKSNYFPINTYQITEGSCLINKVGGKAASCVSKEQMLEYPNWTILIQRGEVNEDIFEELKEKAKKGFGKFFPYLGKSQFAATIDEVKVLDLKRVEDNRGKILGLIKDRDVEVLEDFSLEDDFYFIDNYYPVAYRSYANYYKEDKFLLTNKFLSWSDGTSIYNYEGENIYFF